MRILIIDDEVELVASLRDGLVEAGMEIDAVHDGASGLEAATTGNYDAIICDVLMPKMNGYLVCRELRARGVATPILMLTAKNGEWDQAEALELGADDFLTKPFSFVILTARLKALVRRAGEAPVHGHLVVDHQRQTAEYEGRCVNLTSREFALLNALRAADGTVVAKADLVNQVWGERFNGGDNVVEVYVRYLRTKLATIHSDSMIITVRGHGYRLGVPAVTR